MPKTMTQALVEIAEKAAIIGKTDKAVDIKARDEKEKKDANKITKSI